MCFPIEIKTVMDLKEVEKLAKRYKIIGLLPNIFGGQILDNDSYLVEIMGINGRCFCSLDDESFSVEREWLAQFILAISRSNT